MCANGVRKTTVGNPLYKGAFYDDYTAITDVKAETQQARAKRYYNLMGQPVAHPEAAPGTTSVTERKFEGWYCRGIVFFCYFCLSKRNRP